MTRTRRARLCPDRRAVTYAHWFEGCPDTDPGHVGRPEDVSMQLYTSGTTGLPKGVMLTNANLSTAVSEAGRTFGITADTVSLVAMPLFHIGGSGWALCAMSRGGRSVILRDVDTVRAPPADRARSASRRCSWFRPCS